MNELIDSQVTEEKGSSGGVKFDLLFNIFRKRVKTHARADIREIEKRLIDILDELNMGNLFSLRPEFICIFDELDKIEPSINVHLEQKKAENPEAFSEPETMYFATENIRHRQHTILNILANLKHFLNTAKAKFIFIAGREMYDASLADVSDRNFFIGSIFHDVIYVNSFLTEDSHNKDSDLTSMTERYICQFLFPPLYEVNGEPSLKEYEIYLSKFFGIKGTRCKKCSKRCNENDQEKCWSYQKDRQKVEKIIFTLREFISYLTYRSNGAPKKLTTFFENYIHKPNTEREGPDPFVNSEFTLCVGFSSKNLYLKFDYYDQYTFGMITYLVKPVVLSISRAIKDYGDKLLVSTSFLVDHLYKFHKNAFSWRNIELTPEILDINKAPQLRQLISLIINNLSKSHVLEIVSGLYSFKFHKKISEEISFLSKISEKEAAAFNFTLDESLSLKRHHKRLLRELKARHHGSSVGPQFVNAVSFAHMIIGDFHFYDEEYNDAILEYMEAVQVLRNMDFSAKNASFFVILIRNMLKLGFALEKRKSYVSAFMIYGFLVSKIIKFREVDLDTLGLREKFSTKKEMEKYLRSKENREKFVVDTEFDDIKEITTSRPEDMDVLDEKINLLVKDWDYRIEEIFRTNTKDKKEEVLEKRNKKIKYDQEIILEKFDRKVDKPVCLSQDFGDLLNQTPFTSLKEDLLYGISSFEGIRLIYQPLMAKLQMIEKAQLGGVTLIDLRRIENEFRFITKTINTSEKFMVAAEFWYKIGDILFFKNGLLPSNLYEEVDKKKDDKKDMFYCSQTEALCCFNKYIGKVVQENGFHIPCRACLYYMRSLRILCAELFDIHAKKINRKTLLKTIFEKLSTKSLIIRNSIALRVMANALSGLGNSFLSCCTSDLLPQEGFLNDFLDYIDERNDKQSSSLYQQRLENFSEEKAFNKIEEVFIYYYLAYQFYLRTGENREAAVQMLKILYLIRNLLLMAKPDETKWLKDEIGLLLWKIEKVILRRAIINLYRIYGSVHRLEIEDYKDIFNCEPSGDNPGDQGKNDSIDLKKISLSADFKEYFVIYKEIQIRCGRFCFPENPKDIISLCATTPYYSINKMYNRIIDLNFKVTVNYKIFEQLGLTETFKEIQRRVKTGFPVNPPHFCFSGLFRNNASRIKKKKSIAIVHAILESADNHLLKSKFKEKIVTEGELLQVAEFLVSDSIFCLHEIIKLVGLYGLSYMLNHSVLANAHRRMGDWCNLYFTYSRSLEGDSEAITARKKKFKGELEALLKRDNLKYLSIRYHYEKARESYHSILELHREGKAYRNMLTKMFYLNDDFNDSIYHFSAAAERYRINIGKVHEDLGVVKGKLEDSELYKPDNYLSMFAESPPPSGEEGKK